MAGSPSSRQRWSGRRADTRRRGNVGDITGIWQLTHVGKYQGEVVAANILGEPRHANYDAVPRVVYTDPAAASVGATDARFSAAVLREIAKAETYTRTYAHAIGFLTLLSDGRLLTGAYALGPEAGEWLQQAKLAIRAQVPCLEGRCSSAALDNNQNRLFAGSVYFSKSSPTDSNGRPPPCHET